ncbi:hypothetical protein GINT2_001643 [Glugoides intestinalis]
MVKKKREIVTPSNITMKGALIAGLSLLYKSLFHRKIAITNTEHTFLSSAILCITVQIINSTSLVIAGMVVKGITFSLLDVVSGTFQRLFYSIASHILFSVIFSSYVSQSVFSMVLILQSILAIIPIFILISSMDLFEPRLIFGSFLFVSVEKTMESLEFKTGKCSKLLIKMAAIMLYTFIFKNLKETIFFDT